MKKLLLSVAILTGLSATAQIPDYGVFPAGKTLTDITGTTHDIDALLDAGKSVVIDAFADWCGPCWTYHQAHTLEDLWLAEGPGGNDNIMVFGVEADSRDAYPESCIEDPNNQGNWRPGTTYPLVNDDDIADYINLGYYPTLILVCPDRTVTEVGQVSQAAWTTAINNCSAVPSNSDDPRVIGHDVNGTFLCGGVVGADVELNCVVQNYTAASASGTYTVKFFDGATEIATTDATLSLDPYAWELVTVGTVNLPTGTSNLTARITSANDDSSNDEIAVSVTNITAAAYNGSVAGLNLDITTDGFGSEFAYIWDAGTPDPSLALIELHNACADGSITPLGFGQYGTFTNAMTTINETLSTPTSGCYTLSLIDTYGDGMTYTAGSSLSVSSENGWNASIDPNYGDGVQIVYDITITADIAEESTSLTSASVYPNPSTDLTNVALELSNSSNVSIALINSMGQVVYNNALGNVNGAQTVQINTSNLEAGMYFVNINVDGVTSTQRLSVTK
jgi:hypothetical protein